MAADKGVQGLVVNPPLVNYPDSFKLTAGYEAADLFVAALELSGHSPHVKPPHLRASAHSAIHAALSCSVNRKVAKDAKKNQDILTTTTRRARRKSPC